MPVTLQPWAPLEANIISGGNFATNVDDITCVARPNDHQQISNAYTTSLLQSSFGQIPENSSIIPSTNGFVYTAIKAYAGHHHFVIRPDDIWFAVLTQFSSYVNAHGEDLRRHFVTHKGKQEIRIDYNAFKRHHFDYSVFTMDMSRELAKRVVDPSLKDWIMPSYTTTTKNDQVTASIIMMGMLQKYFSYTMGIICGFPSVTLLGEKSDYEDILSRIAKLKQYGKEPSEFARLLDPVIRRFIISFDEPSSETVDFFWQRIFTSDSRLCGVTLYTGWITAFTFWDEKGRRVQQAYEPNKDWKSPDKSFGEVKGEMTMGDHNITVNDFKPLLLELDGVRYGAVNSENIAPGWTRVPVKIDDGGAEAEMIAGSVGIDCSSTGNAAADGQVGLDKMQPLTGWWIQEKGNDERVKEGTVAQRIANAFHIEL